MSNDLTYLYAAYSIIWAGVFAFVLKLFLTQKKLEREIEALKEAMDDGRGAKTGIE
jgi:CcmD family protein